MLTPETLQALRAAIAQSSSDRRDEFLAAFDGLTTTIAAQALLNRNLAARARNSDIAGAQIDALVGRDSLDALAAALGHPVSAKLSLSDAQAAANQLASDLSRVRSTAATLTAIARIVAIFV